MPLLATPEQLLGNPRPTHLLIPQTIAYSDAQAAFDVYEAAGGELFEWQRLNLIDALGRRFMPDGSTKWAAYEVADELSRRNGKSVKYEVRCLAGIYVFGEREIVYSAHKGETAAGAYNRILELIDADSELKAALRQAYASAGRESIHFKTGQVIRFRTRTAGGGRGLEGDCVIIDEVQEAKDEHIAALMPLMTARSSLGDPQIFYGGSAGHRGSVVLARLIKRMESELAARAAGLPSVEPILMMARWAADLDVDDPADPAVWAKTNPLLGHLMSVEAIGAEYRAMGAAIDPRYFAAERLGVGDYARDESEDWVIPRSRVDAAAEKNPKANPIVGPVMFAIEVSWDRQSASIVAAGFRADGRRQVELAHHNQGTAWVVPEIERMVRDHDNLGVVIDPHSPTSSLIPALRDRGIRIHDLKTADLTAAWGAFIDAFAAEPSGIVHLDDPVMIAAFSYAKTRLVNGATTWKRSGGDDVSPLLAATWAAYLLDTMQAPPKPAAPSRTAPLKAVAPAATQHRSAPNFRSINF